MVRVAREVVIVFALVGMSFWAFGAHWDALMAAILLVGAYAYAAHRRGRLARDDGRVI
jgi:hypothetical protein